MCLVVFLYEMFSEVYFEKIISDLAELISDFTQKEETETNKAKLSKKKIKMQTHSTDEMKQRFLALFYLLFFFSFFYVNTIK